MSGSYNLNKAIKVWGHQSEYSCLTQSADILAMEWFCAFDKKMVSCGEDYVWVSHPDRTPGVIDGYLAAIYIWHFAHGVDVYPAVID